MPSFPLSFRLLALPLWGAARLRAALVDRGGPVLQARVNARHPLPGAAELTRIAGSDAVRGLHLVIEQAGGGWARLAAARAALQRIRASGKFVVIELEHCGNAELYLASVADRVWLRPMGDVAALGVAAVLRFAGDAFARLGVRFDFEAAGAYKSFGEMYTRSFASAPNREAMEALVGELQAELEGAVAEGRGIAPEVVRRVFTEGPLAAADALAMGLVDRVGYADECRAELEGRLGGPFRTVALHRWLRIDAVRDGLERWIEGRPRVIVLHLDGPVVDGEGPPGTPAIAAVPVCRALRALREDDGVKGVVLAVQSPGGSALASDLIWREVEQLVRKKPVIAAFGDVAASGGYYLAAPATEIWALPNTLTGSIGVVGGKLVVGGALAQVGVHSEIVAGAPHATMYGAESAFSPSERARFREGLERFYRGFVERVAAGRRRPYAAVEEHARGRVWTGRRAVELGLVDRIGDTTGAVARVATLAGAHDVSRVDVRIAPRTSRLARLARAWMETAMPEALGDVAGIAAVAGVVGLTAVPRLLLGAQGRPLALWPWEVEVG